VFGKKKRGKTWVPNTPDFGNLKISSLNLKAGVDADGPLWAFKFGKRPTTKKEYELLAGEYDTRKNKKDKNGKVMLPAAVTNLPFSGANLLYKRYMNHAWRDRLDFWDGEYPMCVQSRD